MTSPASASFPWPQAPEPPSGEFRRGRLPSGLGGDYLAARGSRPGPALLLSASSESGYAAVQGLFRLADVLDARRLAGSLLIRVAAAGGGGNMRELLEGADALAEFERLRPGWRELPVASYRLSGAAEIDRQAEQLAAATGLPYRFGSTAENQSEPAAWMTGRGRPVVRLRMPCAVDERAETVERVFQGLIDVLRALGMLEGQLSPAESRALQAPAYAEAPVAGYWTPVARPGQRLRIDDSLGSFRDGQGNELGNLLTNISGILLGVSDEVWVEAGQSVAELARPSS